MEITLSTPKEYHYAILCHEHDHDIINYILNSALHDKIVSPRHEDPYNYDELCKTAKSIGFKFGKSWRFI